MWDNLQIDLRHGCRALLRARSFTATALVVLALGLGATTITFSLIDKALLESRPYPAAERIYHVQSTFASDGRARNVSYPDFEDFRTQATALEALAVAGPIRLVFTDDDSPPVSLVGEYISTGYLELFGVTPLLGRGFVPDETERTSGAERVMLVSESMWRNRFGADDAVVGRLVTTTDGDFEIVGVLPEYFGGATDEICLLCTDVDFWIPAPASVVEYPGILENRGRRWHYMLGRRRAGVTQAAVSAELETIAGRLARAYPATNKDVSARLTPVSEHWRGSLRPGLTALAVGALLLLLIGCANVASLVLARSRSQMKEMAVRVSLGAGPGRLLGQLVTESLLLAGTGAIAGALLASFSMEAIVKLGGDALPRSVELASGGDIVLTSLAMALGVGAVLGLIATWSVWKSDPVHALVGARTTGSEGGSLGRFSVAAQIALVLLLLVNALLLVQSYRALSSADPGFDADDILVAEINPSSPRYEAPGALRIFVDELARRLSEIPGGDDITVAAPNLPPRTFVRMDVAPEGSELDTPGGTLRVETHRVLPNFFSVLRLPLLAGRYFEPGDREQTELVAVVSASLAARLWSGENPLGRRLIDKEGSLAPEGMRVVGVVGDVKYAGHRSQRSGDYDIYLSLTQRTAGYLTIAARTGAGGNDTLTRIRGELAAMDPELAILTSSTVAERFDAQSRDARMQAILIGLFASCAFLLATIGTYGVLRFTVSRRTRELGIRLALGGTPGAVLAEVLRSGMKPVLWGLVVGTILASGARRVVASLLFGVAGMELGMLLLAVSLLSLAAVLACYLPARRASNIDPIDALREN